MREVKKYDRRPRINGRFVCVGPGGPTCSCCFPGPGTSERRKMMKAGKRREKEYAFKVEHVSN